MSSLAAIWRRDEPESEHFEPQIGPHLLKESNVASPAISEVEVGSDHDHSGAQHRAENMLHEMLRGLLAAHMVEAQNEAIVHVARLAQEPELLIDIGEEERRRVRPNDFRRMAIERHDRGRKAAGGAELTNQAQQGAVTEVDAVERPDRDDASGRGSDIVLVP